MNFQKRRQQLLEKIEDNSLVIFFSGSAPLRSEDETYPFVVNRHFFYLTGIDQENMVLLLWKINNNTHETLFIEPNDETIARWVGERMSEKQASNISGIEDIRFINNLDDNIAFLYNRNLRGKESYHLYFDAWHYQPKQAYSVANVFVQQLQKKYPALKIRDIFPHITALRMRKDEKEVAHIQKAIHRTRLGIEALMKNVRLQMNERVMEGIFDFALMQAGCKEHAFDTIAASGIRATTLHYHDNNQVIQDGELFLCDLGATDNHYCADISRTFPVNGVFNERQREIYELVLEAQRIAESMAKPGNTLRDMQQAVLAFYESELPKHGLLKGVSEYYFHGIGHHLGLDTHDVSIDKVLEAGNVITNEPGLYIRDEAIGIRIEDDLLITENGCINLSGNILKSVEEIEKFMQG